MEMNVHASVPGHKSDRAVDSQRVWGSQKHCSHKPQLVAESCKDALILPHGVILILGI